MSFHVLPPLNVVALGFVCVACASHEPRARRIDTARLHGEYLSLQEDPQSDQDAVLGSYSAEEHQLQMPAESLPASKPSGILKPLQSLAGLFLAFNSAAGPQITGSWASPQARNIGPQTTAHLHASCCWPALACIRMSASVEKAEQVGMEEASALLEILPKIAGAGVVFALLLHVPAFANFAAQWQAIGAAGVSGNDFWAPFQFWAFFAAMHPLLQPAVWIGEVLHGSPGPQLADVMPYTFIALNVAVLGALATIGELGTTLNLSLFALFIHYIGCGLEGSKDLSDFNLALDDGIKGCPTYAQVRQKSMDGFDVSKYTGRWYEHGFHDWTQFGEVYDTTLDIELSKDGSRWLDDFAVRGPAPKAAPLSWDKSPVANGAHYFLYGKIDDKTPGILQESGFGVTFPNFIVDVQKDASGQYKEAIQFQCLQRGGVRIFEGINFLSREPEMTPAARAAMFERAKVAGMAPYGATPEQMHEVPHRQPGKEPIENSWQRLWGNIGFDKLLGLVESSTHSAFEDTRGLGS